MGAVDGFTAGEAVVEECLDALLEDDFSTGCSTSSSTSIGAADGFTAGEAFLDDFLELDFSAAMAGEEAFFAGDSTGFWLFLGEEVFLGDDASSTSISSLTGAFLSLAGDDTLLLEGGGGGGGTKAWSVFLGEAALA
jgi:hypothetical protein